jgi:hypothetical protein
LDPGSGSATLLSSTCFLISCVEEKVQKANSSDLLRYFFTLKNRQSQYCSRYLYSIYQEITVPHFCQANLKSPFVTYYLKGSDEHTDAGVDEVLHAARTGFQVLLGSQLLLSQLKIVAKI